MIYCEFLCTLWVLEMYSKCSYLNCQMNTPLWRLVSYVTTWTKRLGISGFIYRMYQIQFYKESYLSTLITYGHMWTVCEPVATRDSQVQVIAKLWAAWMYFNESLFISRCTMAKYWRFVLEKKICTCRTEGFSLHLAELFDPINLFWSESLKIGHQLKKMNCLTHL